MVLRRSSDGEAELVRVSADSVDELIEKCRAAKDTSTLLVAIDEVIPPNRPEGFDFDEFVALASALVNGGVAGFETRHGQVVRRLFATHAAIEAGSVEVLG